MIAVFCAVLFAGLALSVLYHQRADQRQRDRVASYRLSGTESLGPQDGGAARREPARALSWPTNPVIRWANELIGQAGLDFSPVFLLVAQVILFAGGTTFAARWLHRAVAAGIGLVAAYLPVFFLRTEGRRRLKTMAHQMPYVLDMLKSALEAGHTLLRGLQMASANNPEPLASELRFIIDQVRVGVTLPLAIEAMYRRVPVEELGFLSSAVSVQADSGSSLAEILDHVSQSIRYRQRLDDQIRTLTSQSRSSAMIVSALPAVVLGVFSLLRADYVRVLFTNPLGVKLLEAAIVLDFLAFVIMRRIAQVDF